MKRKSIQSNSNFVSLLKYYSLGYDNSSFFFSLSNNRKLSQIIHLMITFLKKEKEERNNNNYKYNNIFNKRDKLIY